MSVSRSAFYVRLERPQTAIKKDDAELIEIIKTLFQKGRKNYGTRRLKNALIGLDRQFTVAQPNQIYVGDIAYIHTWKAGCTWL